MAETSGGGARQEPPVAVVLVGPVEEWSRDEGAGLARVGAPTGQAARSRAIRRDRVGASAARAKGGMHKRALSP